MLLGIGGEAGQVDDGEFRIEALQLLRAGADQQIVHEQRVPGIFGDNAHADPVRQVGAAEQVLGEQLAAFGVGHHVGIKRVEGFRRHRLVVVPPDMGFGGGVAHRELVAGAAAGMDAGAHHQRTVLGDKAFAALHRFFKQDGRAEIEVHGFQIAKAVATQAECGVRHRTLPVTGPRIAGAGRRHKCIQLRQEYVNSEPDQCVMVKPGRRGRAAACHAACTEALPQYAMARRAKGA